MKITDIIVTENIEVGDRFDIELNNIVIETGVVGFMPDGIIVEGDSKTLALLGISGALLENVHTTEAEGDPEGLPHLTKEMLTHIVQQVGKEGAHAIIKSLTWGDGAAKDLLHLIVKDLKQDIKQGLEEAEYHGRKVPLGKPMAGDVKKSKVYVKGPSGKVVKVNFGDKNMRIKKNIPGRRKSFRARHHCATPGPRHKARYWSCRAW